MGSSITSNQPGMAKMAAIFVILFVTLLANSLGSVIETPDYVVVGQPTSEAVRADDDGPAYRFDYSYSSQANGWLKLHRVPSTWNDAKIRCHAEGAVLASPLNVGIHEAVERLVSKKPFSAIFTGLQSVFAEGEYISVEGVPISQLPVTWAAGEPRGGNSRNCVSMDTRGGVLSAVRCSDGLPYVCYKPLVNLSRTACGTSDTDYILHTRLGMCYKFHSRGLDWNKAFLTCIAEGGHLATLNNDIEASAVRSLYEMYPDNAIDATYKSSAHIGFRDLGDGGSWMTIHGQTLSEAGFTLWDNNQPNNSTQYSPEGEACGSYTRSGRLNDVWCGLNMPFVCEKTRTSLN